MKSKALFLLALSATPLTAGVSLSGGTSYVQNFNTLPSATGSTWFNSNTLPNWYLFRSTTDNPTAASAPILINDNDPATAWVSGLYSLGTVGGADRALGSAPTTAAGSYSHIVILRNDTGSPVKITNVKYTVENWRENTTATITETMAFATRIAPLESTLTGGFGTGYTDIPSLSATIPHSGAAGGINDPSLDVVVDGPPPTDLLVPAGSFIALRWLNANDGGSDAYLGLDDVEIKYQTVATAITVAATNIVRNSQNTANPADDTVSFSATVTGLGAVSSSGWVRSSANPGVTGPASGAYGTAVTFTNIPVTAASQTFVFRDAATATAERSVVIAVPPPPAELTASSGPLRITFQTPALGASSFTRDFDDPTSDLGWTSGLPGLPANTTNGVYQRLGDLAEPGSNHYLRINNSRLTAANQFVTEPVKITGLPSVNVAISATAYTSTGTGFEDAATAPTIANSDRIQCFVQVSPNGTTWTQIGAPLIDPATTGPALFEAAKLIDPVGGNLTGMNFADDSALPDPVPFMITRRVSFIPGGNQFARLVLLGGNDSASENMIFDNIEFGIAQNVVAAAASAFTTNNQANDNPADDTYSFTVVVTNQDPLRSQGWTSNVIAGGNPVSGTYGGAGKVFGPFPVSDSPKSILFTDVSDPTVTYTLTVQKPAGTIADTVVLLNREEGATAAYDDDTWSVRATVTSTHGATGWKEESTGRTGLYGTATDLGPFPVSAGGRTFTFMDLGDSSLVTAPVVLDPPSRPVLGIVNFGAGDKDLLNILGADSLVWRAGAEPYTSEQNNGGGTTAHVLRSAKVDLRDATGPVTFTAAMEARDTSTGSNFEANDTFRIDLELESDGGGITSVPLLTAAQDLGNGAPSTAANGAPNGVLNGFTGVAATVNGVAVTVIQDYDANRIRDEFNPDGMDSASAAIGNFQWTYQIPAGFVSASVVVTALNNAATEFFTVKNVRFATGVVSKPDSDGDGSPDDAEAIAGTDPNDATSVFRVHSMSQQPAAGPVGAAIDVGVPTVNGRFYQIYTSSNLQSWTKGDTGGATAGDGSNKVIHLDFPVGPAIPRLFVRIAVNSDGQFPATVP